jgi:hypothetical protein
VNTLLLLFAVARAQDPAGGQPPAPPLAEPSPAPGGAVAPTGITLQLHDPRESLDDAPRVTVEGIDGTLLPVDDGTLGDPRAGDGVYTVSLGAWSGRDVALTVTDGETTWRARGTHDGSAWLWVRIHDARTMQVGNTGEGPGPSDPGAAGGGPGDGAPSPASVVVGAATASWAEWAPSLVVWGAAAAGFAVAFAAGLVRVARAPVAAARLLDAPAFVRVAPTLVPVTEVPGIVAALGPRRWLVVGSWPDGVARTGAAFIVAPGAAAAEVLVTLRTVASREGPPVAVLVTDATILDRRDARPPLDELLALLDGCVPCVCIVGADYGAPVAVVPAGSVGGASPGTS